MKKRRPIRLTPADAEAVLAALPLVVEFEADTARQQTINESIAFSVSHNLARSDFRFTLDEQRVIAAAVFAAQQFLSGHLNGFFPDIQPEELADLRKYFFTYNRLAASCSDWLADG